MTIKGRTHAESKRLRQEQRVMLWNSIRAAGTDGITTEDLLLKHGITLGHYTAIPLHLTEMRKLGYIVKGKKVGYRTPWLVTDGCRVPMGCASEVAA